MCPIAFWIGNWPVHWYGLSYTFGILLGWGYGYWLIAQKIIPNLTPLLWDRFINKAIFGIIIGGRIGHILLYPDPMYWENPLEMLAVWKGGMAFHGGLLGLCLTAWLHARRHRISFRSILDILACCAPIGIFLGRLANYINQEMYGRPTCVRWGVIFSRVDDTLRHPSQIYEALSEGLLLFLVLAWCALYRPTPKKPGVLAAIFCLGYAAARWGCEYLREPLDGIWLGLTSGQIYTLPLVGLGAILLVYSHRPSRHASHPSKKTPS
jgi:phosphatidylglycerol:prolipoprotein diacylglycerol transferase